MRQPQPAPTLASELVRIEALRPHPRNPRRGDVEAIAESIRTNGFYGHLLVQRSTGYVLVGRHRLEALGRLIDAGDVPTFPPNEAGEREPLPQGYVPAMYLDVNDDAAMRLLLADNRTSDRAGYDDLALADLLADLGELEGTGYQDNDLASLLRKLDGPKPRVTAPDDEGEQAPELDLPEEPITRPGNLWRLGRHRILCGDSTVPADLERLLGGNTARMVATDPPFAIYGSSTGVSTDIADDKMVRPFFEAILRICFLRLPKFGHAYVHCDWRSWAAVWDSAHRAGMTPKNLLVWDKGHTGLGQAWRNTHEFVGFFVKVPQKTAMRATDQIGGRTIDKPNMLRFPRVLGAERLHNASKPVALIEELLDASSDEGDVVLDMFLGSGSTTMAAERANRCCFGMEIEPRIVDVAVKRWEQATGEKAVLIDG